MSWICLNFWNGQLISSQEMAFFFVVFIIRFIMLYLPPKHASRTNSRNIIGRDSLMVIPLLANQDLTPMLYLPPKHASRATPRSIIRRDSSMVIPLLANQDLTPILTRWAPPFSCSARNPRAFALKVNQFLMQCHSNYIAVIVNVIVSLPF